MINTNKNTQQTNTPGSIAAIQQEKQHVKYCSSCKTELKAKENVQHTRFGLDLCEDCLYF